MTVELADSYESLFDRAIEQAELGNTPGAIDLFQRIVNRLSKLGPETWAHRPKRRNFLLTTLAFCVEFLRFFLSGLACAIRDDLQTMHRHMQNAIKILKRDWPPRSKIAGRRSPVTDLVSDPEALTALGEYREHGEDKV